MAVNLIAVQVKLFERVATSRVNDNLFKRFDKLDAVLYAALAFLACNDSRYAVALQVAYRLWSCVIAAHRMMLNIWQRVNHSLRSIISVSYTHLRAHETPEHLVCRL